MLWQLSWAQQKCTLMFISNARTCYCSRVSAALMEGTEGWECHAAYVTSQDRLFNACVWWWGLERLLNDRIEWAGKISCHKCILQTNFEGFGGVQLAALLLLVHMGQCHCHLIFSVAEFLWNKKGYLNEKPKETPLSIWGKESGVDELIVYGNVQVAIVAHIPLPQTLPHLSCIFLVLVCLHPARRRTSVVN